MFQAVRTAQQISVVAQDLLAKWLVVEGCPQ
jgi:hypothetical protein